MIHEIHDNHWIRIHEIEQKQKSEDPCSNMNNYIRVLFGAKNSKIF